MKKLPVIMPTYEGFIEFVEMQPDGKKIDHTGGWTRCAIGDYMKDLGLTGMFNSMDFVHLVLSVVAPEVYDILNHPYEYNEDCEPVLVAPATYGELADMLVIEED